MRYIRSFSEHLSIVENISVNKYQNLCSDINIYNYIMGNSYDKVNETINDTIMDRLVAISRRGLMTASLMASLMSTPSFANEYNALSSSEKTEINNMISGDDNKDNGINAGTVSINIGNSFPSGEYNANINDFKIKQEFDKLVKFIKSSGEQNFTITINASESLVPNKDINTGERLAVGELSKLRSKSAENLIIGYMKTLGINAGFNIIKNIQIGKQPWDGGNASAEKYIKEQYVEIKIEATKCPLCDFKRVYQGNEVGSEQDYIGYEQSFETAGMLGSGVIDVKTGSIPDRVVILGDGVIIGDSSYVADETHKYKEYEYVPSYVAALNRVLLESSNSNAIGGDKIRKVKVDTFNELMGILLKPEYNDLSKYTPSKDLRKEIRSGLDQLKIMFESGQRVFIMYEHGKIELEYNLDRKYSEVKVLVYSPIGKTGFNMEIKCSGK